MSELAVLARLKSAEWRNRLRGFRDLSLLKLFVVGSFGVALWAGLYLVFLRGFRFIEEFQFYRDEILQSLFYLFFFSLTLMLVISNGIIAHTSLFRSKETEFLMSVPLRPQTVYLYKFAESLAFSSWAFLFLATPLMAAFGSFLRASWLFYVLTLLMFALYIVIPAALGALLALGLTAFFPKSKRAILVFLALGAAVTAGVFALRLAALRSVLVLEQSFAVEVFDRFGFCRNPLLPSYWVAKGTMILARGLPAAPAGPTEPAADALSGGIFFFGLIAANVLFLLAVAVLVSERLYPRGWNQSQFLRRHRRYRGRDLAEILLAPLLWPLPFRVRVIVEKDVRTFFRDPAQWTQFLIFFGLLALYFVNLRTFRYDGKDIFWKNLIANLNLAATCLTLSTFTSRFLYPQISTEGRRFWVLGMAPMERRTILTGKFAFAMTGSLLLSLVLIGVSNAMLRIPAGIAAVHAFALAGICAGLSGLSIGLGALYPDFRQDNISKIVSGYGGTLNLVLSLFFVVLILALQGVPSSLYFKGQLGERTFFLWTALALAAIAVVSATACAVPMLLGMRALKRLEV